MADNRMLTREDYVPPHPSPFPITTLAIPSAEKFLSRADHFSILLREFIHWAEVRTAWMHNMAAREFVAEAGMHILGQELGVPHTQRGQPLQVAAEME